MIPAGHLFSFALPDQPAPSAFQYMMEAKLDLIRLTQWATGAAGLVLLVLLLAGLSRQVLRPLAATRLGFDRVAQGDFAHRVAVPANHELGAMTTSFNALAERINSLFRLSARINHGASLDDTLGFVREEFSRFLPIDWIGVLTQGIQPNTWLVERHATHLPETMAEGDGHEIALATDAPARLDLDGSNSLCAGLRDAGRHFDPAVVAAFERALPKIMTIYTQHRHV